jgi:hypothetical protein
VRIVVAGLSQDVDRNSRDTQSQRHRARPGAWTPESARTRSTLSRFEERRLPEPTLPAPLPEAPADARAVRDERSMRVIEYAVAFLALAVAILLGVH